MSRKKVVYIAGPITGVEKYWEPFEAAADKLQAAGFIPLTPTWQPQGLTNAQHIHHCFPMIDSADAVLFLPRWDDSKGARLEWLYCDYIGKPSCMTINYLKEVLKDD